MNCGPHRADPRSAEERKFLCDECHTYSRAELQQRAARAKPVRMVDADGRVWYWTGEIAT